jgi:hypothetical protein
VKPKVKESGAMVGESTPDASPFDSPVAGASLSLHPGKSLSGMRGKSHIRIESGLKPPGRE